MFYDIPNQYIHRMLMEWVDGGGEQVFSQFSSPPPRLHVLTAPRRQDYFPGVCYSITVHIPWPVHQTDYSYSSNQWCIHKEIAFHFQNLLYTLVTFLLYMLQNCICSCSRPPLENTYSRDMFLSTLKARWGCMHLQYQHSYRVSLFLCP